MDVKRFARFQWPGQRTTGDRHRSGQEKRARVGWEFAHSVIDDHSRLVYTELLCDEQAASVTGFLERALEFFASHGISARQLQHCLSDRRLWLCRMEPDRGVLTLGVVEMRYGAVTQIGLAPRAPG